MTLNQRVDYWRFEPSPAYHGRVPELVDGRPPFEEDETLKVQLIHPSLSIAVPVLSMCETKTNGSRRFKSCPGRHYLWPGGSAEERPH